jgi:hypothetical protein
MPANPRTHFVRFHRVLCGAFMMFAPRTTTDENEVTCARCLLLLAAQRHPDHPTEPKAA